MDWESTKCIIIMMFVQVVGALIQPIFFRVADRRAIELSVLIAYIFCGGFVVNSIMACYYSEWKNWGELSWKDILFSILFGPLGKNLKINMTSLAKVVGIVLMPIIGAVFQGFMNVGSLTVQSAQAPAALPSKSSSLKGGVIGFMLNLLGSTNAAAWFTNYIMEKMSKKFSYTYTMAALMNFCGAVASFIYCAIRYHDIKYFNLSPNPMLVGLAGGCVILSAFATAGTIYCVKSKDTAYVAAYSNVSLIIDTIAAPLVINKKVEWGSVGCVVVLIFGVSLYNWANNKEADATSQTLDNEQGSVQPEGDPAIKLKTVQSANDEETISSTTSDQRAEMIQIVVDQGKVVEEITDDDHCDKTVIAIGGGGDDDGNLEETKGSNDDVHLGLRIDHDVANIISNDCQDSETSSSTNGSSRRSIEDISDECYEEGTESDDQYDYTYLR